MKKANKFILLSCCLCFVVACTKEAVAGFGNKRALVSWYNDHLPAYIELNGCNSSCMYELLISDTEDMIYWKINHNFREEVVHAGMDKERFKTQVEKYFRKTIHRFNDFKINPGLNDSYEPSTLISDDGEKIELFSPNGMYYESSDGINWTTGERLIMSNGCIPLHFSVNRIDGLYYLCGRVVKSGKEYLDLYTSTDKIHFEFKGHIVSTGDDLGNGFRFDSFGNSFLLKTQGGKFYFYYEGARHKSDWSICLMTSTDIIKRGNDGFIGEWSQCPENPILPYANRCFAGETPQLYCNPEIVKGEDNMPLIVDGKYYMYYLSYFYKANTGYAILNRMYSTDLVHWTEEGSMFDVRDVPTGGEAHGDNGDQSLCQFKGKSYLFYTLNANSYGYGTPNIRYSVDNRPLDELMKLKP